ncbi:MAG: hypothetical protein IKL82_00710 [Clostridia bacterium]|nr:hypothetical protein [Clostridia bacterium]
MKRIIALLTLMVSIFTLTSCSLFEDNSKPKYNEVPQESIEFTSIIHGNVIQDGKVGIMLTFTSNYDVIKIEAVGALVNASGETVIEFEKDIHYGTASKNPKIVIRVDEAVFRSIRTAKFTSVKAYTLEEIVV